MVFNPWWTKMTWNPSVFFQLVLEKNGLGLEVDILENYGIGSETDVSLVDQDDLNWSSSTLMVFNPWDSKLFKSSWSIKDTSVSLPIPPRPSTTSVFVTIVLTSKWTGVSLKGCRQKWQDTVPGEKKVNQLFNISHYTDTHLYVFSLVLTLPLIINSTNLWINNKGVNIRTKLHTDWSEWWLVSSGWATVDRNIVGSHQWEFFPQF